MTFVKIKSYAKLNLALNITGKTSSLHKIESIVAFVGLHDDIFIKKIRSKTHNITFNGKFSQNIKKDNTISKLLDLLERKKLLNNKKFKIRINKRIPNKAGLGGGSMNAANIIKYFIKKKIIKIKKKELLKISRLIGSDVVLGLNSVNSVINSKNDIKNFTNCKKFYTLIVKPNFGCSTRDIYLKVRKLDKPKFNHPNKMMFNLDYLKKMSNSLEPIAMSKYPKLRKIKFFLENLSQSVFVRMTGSGSALVAYFQSKERCDNAKKQFNKKYKNYWCIASKTI
jgi:4-diphosphocytidyl-2-C-methyl-D-erythritol kinase